MRIKTKKEWQKMGGYTEEEYKLVRKRAMEILNQDKEDFKPKKEMDH